jgi:hypothetical protein
VYYAFALSPLLPSGPQKMTISDPQEIADKGERIYRERYQQEFEGKYTGQFVAIDVNSGLAYVGAQPEVALEQARAAAPAGLFHLIRVGSQGAFRLSHAHTTAAAHRTGLFRPRG